MAELGALVMAKRVGPWLRIDFAKEVGREAMDELAWKVSRLVFEEMPNHEAGVWIKDAPWIEQRLQQLQDDSGL